MTDYKYPNKQQSAQINWIRTKLKQAEKSGFTNDCKEQILAEAKSTSTPSQTTN